MTKNKKNLLILGTLLVGHGVYWLWGSFFIMLDYTGWLSHYKVQPNTNQPPNAAKLAATIKQVLLNQLVISVPFSVFAFYLLKLSSPRAIDLDRCLQVPSFEWLLLEVVFHEFAYEVSFYLTHRYNICYCYSKTKTSCMILKMF